MTVPSYLNEPMDPADVDDHFWFVGDWMRSGETIAEHSVTSADAAFQITGVTFDVPSRELRWRYAGGVAGQDYLVTLFVRTNTGRSAERTVRYPVRNL
jgi:hypothetical protein